MHGIDLPNIINPSPPNIIIPMIVNNPWRAAIHLNLNPLPKGARDHLPNFSGDGKTTVDEHLNAFNVAYGIIFVQHEDVVVRLFVQTLIGVAMNWFYHLPNSAITDW